MKKTKRRHPLFLRILIPLLVVMVGQAIIYFASTVYGGVSSTLRENAEAVLAERVQTQQNAVETRFLSQWSNFNQTTTAINEVYEEVAGQADTPLYSDTALQKELLGKSTDALVAMLRANEVNGVYLILNNTKDYTPLQAGKSVTNYGLCIRDYTPTADYSDNTDLQLLRGPSTVAAAVNCSLESRWEALYQFDDANPGDYYYKPLELAYENPDVNIQDLAYFSGLHNYSAADRAVVSYSMPLMDKDGHPYGVLGVELTSEYLKTLIPSSSLHSGNAGCYALVRYTEGSNEFYPVTYDGVIFQQCFGDNTSFTVERKSNGLIESKKNRINQKMCGALVDLQIYNHNTPFESERLAVVGFVRTDALYEVATLIQNRLLGVSLGVLLIGVLAVLVISRRLTFPINELSAKVRNAKGDEPPKLDRLDIDEIDDLVEAIEGLSEKVSRNAVRTEFFSRMSHDMRTPMNAIIGFSSPEMTENATETELQTNLTKIHTSGNYLLSLINDVLDMTKIESQRMELRAEPLTADEVVGDVKPVIEEVAKERGVNFVVEVEDSGKRFLADRQRVAQILMNLLSNAIKFTPPGGTVRLAYSDTVEMDGRISHHIVVQDTGSGMSEDFQKKMYEPFSQEGTTEGGTGLGLSITKQLVELMGGTIRCVSEPGKGTKFTIELQGRAAPEVNGDTGKRAAPAVTFADCDMTGKRVLVCEDQPLNMQITTRLLARRGIVVTEAENGAIGLETFNAAPEGSFDLILMDIRMPELDGLETTRAIRALDRGDAKTVPIIAMTANAFKEDVEASCNAGMNDHLSKPIDPQLLYITLGKYLDEKKA